MFVNHLPERYKDDAPQLVHQDDGTDTWTFRETVIRTAALNAVAGRPRRSTASNRRPWTRSVPVATT